MFLLKHQLHKSFPSLNPVQAGLVALTLSVDGLSRGYGLVLGTSPSPHGGRENRGRWLWLTCPCSLHSKVWILMFLCLPLTDHWVPQCASICWLLWGQLAQAWPLLLYQSPCRRHSPYSSFSSTGFLCLSDRLLGWNPFHGSHLMEKSVSFQLYHLSPISSPPIQKDLVPILRGFSTLSKRWSPA